MADELIAEDEVLALRVEFDLVPEWSNVVERMARHFGEEVEVGAQADAMVVKVRIKRDQKDAFVRELDKYWQLFSERRKREGRWSSR